MKKLTNLLLAGKMKERRKKQWKNAAISGSQMQSMVEQKWKQLADSLMQFCGVHNSVRRSQHQEN